MYKDNYPTSEKIHTIRTLVLFMKVSVLSEKSGLLMSNHRSLSLNQTVCRYLTVFLIPKVDVP